MSFVFVVVIFVVVVVGSDVFVFGDEGYGVFCEKVDRCCIIVVGEILFSGRIDMIKILRTSVQSIVAVAAVVVIFNFTVVIFNVIVVVFNVIVVVFNVVVVVFNFVINFNVVDVLWKDFFFAGRRMLTLLVMLFMGPMVYPNRMFREACYFFIVVAITRSSTIS